MLRKYIQVEGASIYFEVEGSGPYLLFVPGGDGGGVGFKPLRKHLIKHFTVVIYDRRGFFRSKLNGPQDSTRRFELEADDIYNLMKSLSVEKFIIFGTSFGGAISLHYLTKYPDTISKMFLHEPIANLGNLDNVEEMEQFHIKLHNIYKSEGKDAATKVYGARYLNDALDYHIMVSKQVGNEQQNWNMHLENEVHIYPFYNLNVDAICSNSDKLVLIYGIKCLNTYICKPVVAISEYLNAELTALPGGHIGYFTETDKFHAQFIKICKNNLLIKDVPKL